MEDPEENETLIAQDLTVIPKPAPKKSFYWKYCGPPVFIGIFTLFWLTIFLQSTGDSLESYHAQIVTRLSGRREFSRCNLTNAPALPGHLPSDTKVILFWTKFFGEDNPYLHDKLEACRQRKCFSTADRRYLSQADAVVFHVRDLSSGDLPDCRDDKQFYVFFLLESPEHTGLRLDQAPWPGFFNLTWTYRLDSDIVCPLYFDKYQPSLWTDRNGSREFLRKKYDKALIFTSNCHTPSRREDYIRDLNQHFPVHVIGACGTDSCPRSDKECDNRVHMYKFYLSFENSNCRDYMTEKAVRPYNVATVPVVLGGGNYSLCFPPDSFIHTAAYRTPKDLADYLNYLVGNFTAYERFYEWKFEPRYTALPAVLKPADVSMCRLCDILHDAAFPSKCYDDIQNWWATSAQCRSGP